MTLSIPTKVNISQNVIICTMQVIGRWDKTKIYSAKVPGRCWAENERSVTMQQKAKLRINPNVWLICYIFFSTEDQALYFFEKSSHTTHKTSDIRHDKATSCVLAMIYDKRQKNQKNDWHNHEMLWEWCFSSCLWTRNNFSSIKKNALLR